MGQIKDETPEEWATRILSENPIKDQDKDYFMAGSSVFRINDNECSYVGTIEEYNFEKNMRQYQKFYDLAMRKIEDIFREELNKENER